MELAPLLPVKEECKAGIGATRMRISVSLDVEGNGVLTTHNSLLRLLEEMRVEMAGSQRALPPTPRTHLAVGTAPTMTQTPIQRNACITMRVATREILPTLDTSHTTTFALPI